MLGFKSTTTADVILSGIEMVAVIRKRQGQCAEIVAEAAQGPSSAMHSIPIGIDLARHVFQVESSPCKAL
jgi:hypothetical protein